ncbi:MAG: hypothetical protein M0Q51_12175 [Bacteroidales bacterium]|nr:hypothetical protein [Bacteroidales bacterium]
MLRRVNPSVQPVVFMLLRVNPSVQPVVFMLRRVNPSVQPVVFMLLRVNPSVLIISTIQSLDFLPTGKSVGSAGRVYAPTGKSIGSYFFIMPGGISN